MTNNDYANSIYLNTYLNILFKFNIMINVMNNARKVLTM